MATYYEHSASQTAGISAPSGTFTRASSGLSIIVSSSAAFRTAGGAWTVLTVSGDGEANWTTGVVGYKQGITGLSHSNQNFVISSVSGSLSGVTGIGTENSFVPGLYLLSNVSNDQTFTPAKAGYTFNPSSFTFNSGSGGGAAVQFTSSVVNFYKAVNPGPEDDAIDINRISNLTWDEGASATDDYDVWFGTPGNMVLVGTEITTESFSIQDYLNEGVDPEDPTVYLDLNTEYEWRIDSYVNNELVATGDVWSYTTRAQRTVVLSSPSDTGIDVLLQPLLEWAIDGIGAQYGSFEDQDFLFIYLRKDDANFTEDDLIGNFVEAFVNDDLQVVAGLEYNTTYYWQVQAGNTAADLADSEVWSFTVQAFSPPAYSVHPVSGLPTGESNQITVRRLVAIANNKFWYEGI